MKHYYRFILNYDEDETRIFISPKELKKDDVAVVHSYGKQFAIGTVLEPVSELEALTGHQRKCIEDVICLVDVTNYRSADFKVLYEAYLKTLSPVTDDVNEILDEE